MSTPTSPQPALNYRPIGFKDAQSNLNQQSFNYLAFQGDDSSGTTLTYKGWARPGSSTSAAVWQIQKLTYDASGNVLTITWPENALGAATADFIFAWSDRANYTYS